MKIYWKKRLTCNLIVIFADMSLFSNFKSVFWEKILDGIKTRQNVNTGRNVELRCLAFGTGTYTNGSGVTFHFIRNFRYEASTR